MTKRIFRSIFLVALAVLLACLALIMGVLYDYFGSLRKTQLSDQTVLAAQGIEGMGKDYFTGLSSGNFRVTWIAADGTVLNDTQADPAAMENHLDRVEVQQALKSGFGESSHFSKTLLVKMLYAARRLPDGTIVRVSTSQYAPLSFLVLMLQPIAAMLILALVLSGLLASRVSKQIVRPLNALNLDDPLSNDTYDELSPLLTRIERQHRQINEQVGELHRRQEEFSVVTGSMSEGLTVLNGAGTILSMNAAACRLLGTDDSAVGRDILTVNRSLALQELLQRAQTGERGETLIDLSGGHYQVTASPVVNEGRVSGIVLLIFDITERARAEEMRREFTANVSHELKTPLHSISGCAEIIKNGLVKPEDLPQFIDQIYAEAQRLIVLVDDIIRLSRLDESNSRELPREDVALLFCAQEVAQRLDAYAATRGITLSVTGDSVVIPAVPRLVNEILYNLTDNAIKYNRDGGRVDIHVASQPDAAVLTVRDNGIGISKEHQSRIFERFYRVDKSHSKEIGGTGLGLSIVKHSAMLLGASIEVDSTPGKGTAITVRFPK